MQCDGLGHAKSALILRYDRRVLDELILFSPNLVFLICISLTFSSKAKREADLRPEQSCQEHPNQTWTLVGTNAPMPIDPNLKSTKRR